MFLWREGVEETGGAAGVGMECARDAGTLAQAQKNHANSNQRTAAARQPPPAPNEAKAAKNMLTSSQRAEAKQPAPT